MCCGRVLREGVCCVNIAREARLWGPSGVREGMCDMCDVGGGSELSGVAVLGRGVYRVGSARSRGACVGVAMSGISPQRSCGKR